MTNPRVAGVGLTHFGRHPERTSRDLFAEAGLAALDDAGVGREHVDAVYYGNFMGELAEHQGHTGPLAAEAVGLTVPATRYESACASSGAALRNAIQGIRAGEHDVVLVGGAERMNNVSTARATEALAIAADALWEVEAGMTFPGAYALMADAYLREFDASHEDLAHIAVKNHANALANDHAQYQREITVDEVLDAPTIAEPLTLYDSCPITDGASAVIVTSEAFAAEAGLEAPVRITGSGQGGDHMALADRATLTRTPAASAAAEAAYGDAGIEVTDIDVAEVHDCFTIAEVLAIEALGLYDGGQGAGAARRGETTIDGELPVNLSGGLKAKGHPVGATGTSQIAELVSVLRGDHPHSDAVTDATTGVAHNAGGTVGSAVVHVLEVGE